MDSYQQACGHTPISIIKFMVLLGYTDVRALGLFHQGGLVFQLVLLGRQNREKESKMAVAKRQGREKPAKIEQRKV